MIKKDYIQFLESVKHLVLISRYNAAKYVNREVLVLYYVVGRMLSLKIQHEGWGAKVITNISNDIQKDMPGIRGFSITNLKNMKAFYEKYSFLDESETEIEDEVILLLRELKAISENKTFKKKRKSTIGQTASDQLYNTSKTLIGQTASDQIFVAKSRSKKGKAIAFNFQNFFSISFSHHLILLKFNKIEEITFYIDQTVLNQWSVNVLQFNIDKNLFRNKNKSNNFKTTLPKKLYEHALQVFRDDYIVNHLNNVTDINDERVLEQHIVQDIKNFILSLGRNFAFIGNQYRIEHEEEEFFIDLLFFQRELNCLVAVELKAGKFKAEYAGKMNLYINLLNHYTKLKHENPTIGIILCAEKKDSIVKFAMQGYTKPIAVSKYKKVVNDLNVMDKLPKKIMDKLPKPEELRQILINSKNKRNN
jgi:predicted nuclease of restriction endonuclease-like (RecB) superfamily